VSTLTNIKLISISLILSLNAASADSNVSQSIRGTTMRDRLIGIDFKTRELKAYRIRENTGIYIVRFESSTKTYLVRIEGEPAVGPNITTLEWLVEAIDNGSSVKDFKRYPKRLVGGYFKIKKPLWLLTEDELVARSTKVKN